LRVALTAAHYSPHADTDDRLNGDTDDRLNGDTDDRLNGDTDDRLMAPRMID
jgi:hypothetical protein